MRTDYDLQQGERYRLLPKGDSTPTDTKWQEYARQQKENRKEQKVKQTSSTVVKATNVEKEAEATVTFSPEDEAFIKVLNEYYGASLPPHTKHERFQTDFPLPDARMAVLVRTKGIHGVVEVNRLEPTDPHDTVELSQNAIEVVYDVIAAVPHMARIKAHTQRQTLHVRLRKCSLRAVDNRFHLFKVAANFAAFPRHRLHKHGRGESLAVLPELRREDAREH